MKFKFIEFKKFEIDTMPSNNTYYRINDSNWRSRDSYAAEVEVLYRVRGGTQGVQAIIDAKVDREA